jgi:uroporphyrinogen III methyltransferase/synthase
VKVYLIGAGPGDPGLLTLKGRDVLGLADVIVYDYLANSSFLGYARPDAEAIYVGKKGSEHTLPQEEINALVIEKAREGKIVARLKGGDPYMFGRGGEEAEALAAAGLPFEVVPGVTSAIAATAYAGIPVTHRAYASSVIFATGHEQPGKLASALDWAAMVKSGATLVFFMGMQNLEEICSNLMEAGMSGRMPAALVRHGTTPHHASLVSTLRHLPAEARKAGFAAPALIIVGKVVKLHDQLNWFEKKPLLGKNIVVTRAREQASDIAALLTEQGANVIQFPTISIRPVEDLSAARKALSCLGSYSWVAFASANSVRFFWDQLYALGADSRALASCKIAAVGPSTAQALKQIGLRPDFMPDRYTVESVVQGLLAMGVRDKRILMPRARLAKDGLADQLRAAGASVEVLSMYGTVPSDTHRDEVLELLKEGQINCITFASSSTVDNFMSLVPGSELKKYPNVRYACIGPITAKTLEKHGIKCDFQPTSYTIPALVNILVEKLPF